MAAYFLKRIDAVVKSKGELHWQHVLEIEFGGMNDVSEGLSRGGYALKCESRWCGGLVKPQPPS